MADQLDNLPVLDMTNTKKELLDAYNALLKQFQQKGAQVLVPERQIEEKRVKETIKIADGFTEAGLVAYLNNLKQEISKMLTDISQKLETETEKYNKIKEAIEVKNKELVEMYEIEKSAHSLAALINAQHQKKEEFDEKISTERTNFDEKLKIERATFDAKILDEKTKFDLDIKTRREKFDSEMQEKKELWAKEQKQHELDVKERDAEVKKTRDREKEEYLYNFNREKQLAEDALKDMKLKVTKDLEDQRIKQEQEFVETKVKLDEREKTISEREKLVNELQKKVDTFPKELETQLAKAVKDVTDKLTLEKKNQLDLLVKDNEGKMNVAQSKIEALDKAVTDQKSQIEKLSAQLSEAYEKVQSIAMKTVEGSSNSKMLNDIQKMIIEKQGS